MKMRFRFSSFWLIYIGVFAGLVMALLPQGCMMSPRGLTPLPSSAASSDAVPSSPAPFEGRGRGPSEVGALVSGAEELWVLARAEGPSASPEPSPGSGALLAKIDHAEIPMPLKYTEVRASVSGYIGTVEVAQQFLNPYSGKIEVVYVFPLPHHAAVNEFIMTIGERRIRGLIRERKEAEAIYADAKQQGYVASLLTEKRPNVFTQRVANLEPGKEIDVHLKYFHTLEYVDGWYEFVFPMVVGPRFSPPGTTNGIGAVARGQSGGSGQETEVHYLRPGERTSHGVSLKADVDAGVPIEEFECRTHQIAAESSAPERLSVSLAPTERLPNKDFALRYRVAGDRIKSALMTHRDERGGFFTLMLYPPQELRDLKRQPLELVFVLDCSGSMAGRPMEQAKAAVQQGLRLLQPGDSFQIVTFSLTASSLGANPLEATPSNIGRGLQHVRSLQGEGGTMMIEGLKAALDFPHDPQRLRFVCFLTDGYIGNEAEILGEIHRRLGASRIFSFGIGSSVNRYLLDHLAKAGRGAVAYLGPNDSAAQIMEDFFTRISHPAMTDLATDWGSWHVTEVFPSALPDLFVGRPVVLAGRFAGQADTVIHVNGTAPGQPVQLTIPASVNHETAAHNGLAAVWARMKMAELADRSTYQPDSELPEAIKRVALDYGLMSPFTAFIAVDATHRTEGSEGTTVPVAVPVPEGVKYKTTVKEQ